MEDLGHRIEISARHLGIVDSILDGVNAQYREMRQRLLAVPGYKDLADQLYHGQSERQMVLGDLLLYIVTGRGYWAATESEEGFKDFIRMIMYTVNLLLIQETVLSARTSERQAFLESLRAANLEHFFASEKEQELYAELEAYEATITVREPRPLYKVMDSLLPRSLGTVNELLVYVYLLNRRIGYVVPLLVLQRLFGRGENIAPPDFLLIRSGGDIFGIEVGEGIGRFSLTRGKFEQVNRFSQDTSIPILTTTAPHLYRCETCEEWITFCEEAISKTSQGETIQEDISCPSCPHYDEGGCPDITYYGQIEVRGKRRRRHYRHHRDDDYLQSRSLRSPEIAARKLIQYLPVVRGLERLTRYS